MHMTDEINPLELIRDYSKELKDEFQKFTDGYHAETLKLWTDITIIKEQIRTMKEEQKKQAKMWGLIGGAIPASITIAIGIFMYWISKIGQIPGAGP